MAFLSCDYKRIVGLTNFFISITCIKLEELRKHFGSNTNIASYNKALLAKDVLEEVPKQLTSWMRSRGFSPKPPRLPESINS